MYNTDLEQLMKIIADEVNVKEVIWETPEGSVTFNNDKNKITEATKYSVV